MAISPYYKNLLLRTAVFQDPFPAIDYYLGLLVETTEVTDANYARQLVAFTDSGSGYATNTSQKIFPAAASAYLYNNVALFDAKTGGNQCVTWNYYDTQIAIGQQVIVQAGELTFTFA